MTTEAAAKPLDRPLTSSWIESVSNALRKLPPRVVRILIILDTALALLVPPYGYFYFCRWKGKILSPGEFLKLGISGYRFAWAHLTHNAEGTKTGAFYVDWSAPPARRTLGVERADWKAKGTCGTCMQCCSTTWLPEGKRASCPFLAEKGCSIYGGLYWDYFNCGRYPSEPSAVGYYGCPRFEGVFEKKLLPMSVGSGNPNESRGPRKLPVLAASSPPVPASVAAAPSQH